MAFNEQDDPFADVTFNAPLPSVNADDLSLVLKSFGPQGTVFSNIASGPANADTKDGVKRVNQNSAETGVVGFKDAKGQAVFTNVAIDPATNKDASLGIGQPSNMGGQPAPINTPNALNSILDSLGKAQDAGTARGLFSSFQEAAAKEQVRLQADALTHAQNKIGVPSLERKLAEAETADKSDPMWYPGIGDSPITQKLRTELNTARGYADTEAKRLLENNLSYKLLGTRVSQAQKEMERIQKLKDRKDALEDTRTLHNDDWKRRKEYQEEQEAEALTSVQMARVQLLSAQDFVDEPNPKVKAFKILKNHKSKDFQAAINAEGAELSVMAVKGNAYAQTLFMTEEAANTGLPQAQIKANLDAMRKAMDNPKFMETVLKDRYGNDKAALQRELGAFQASAADPSKKSEITDQKARLAFEWVARKKTQTYLQDTSSWDSIDPAFKAAQDKAIQTTGKRDLENTLVAYLGDSTGPERLQKLADFDGIARTAAQRHAKSMFGMPDYREAGKIIASKAVEEGIFRKWLSEQSKKGLNATTGLAMGGPAGMAAGAIWDLGNRLESAIPLNPLFESKPAINPTTGKPFGE